MPISSRPRVKFSVNSPNSKHWSKISSDNGGEYINDKFANLRKNSGIIHQTTVPYPPQQNGLAERMNRTLTERASCMLSHMQVEEKWWAEAMNTAGYVTNRVPCPANQFKTPFEVCFGRKPSVATLKCLELKVMHISTNPRDPNSTEKLTNVCFRAISKASKGIVYGIWKPFVWKRLVQLNLKNCKTQNMLKSYAATIPWTE